MHCDKLFAIMRTIFYIELKVLYAVTSIWSGKLDVDC